VGERAAAQRIDRYQLPLYLLLGEPQSGKSILLRKLRPVLPLRPEPALRRRRHEGLRLVVHGIQAVILDLAGRLFTHEGGASDEPSGRPSSSYSSTTGRCVPANGVMLVLPATALRRRGAEDRAEGHAMQAALTTLTEKLQARLPVYVVLTKADKVFGFAECVHRLDAPKRHEMFGWSRALEKLEAPFDVAEAQDGFQGIVERRAALALARCWPPPACPTPSPRSTRFYAFPEELAALWPTLSLYLQRVFTESRLIDKLFFRAST
jgi:type VI secretion system protein ImpL